MKYQVRYTDGNGAQQVVVDCDEAPKIGATGLEFKLSGVVVRIFPQWHEVSLI